MTVDQASTRWNLVGHDFSLFLDTGYGQSSLVYYRKGFDYGICLV